jgi:hypothetical protein
VREENKNETSGIWEWLTIGVGMSKIYHNFWASLSYRIIEKSGLDGIQRLINGEPVLRLQVMIQQAVLEVGKNSTQTLEAQFPSICRSKTQSAAFSIKNISMNIRSFRAKVT